MIHFVDGSETKFESDEKCMQKCFLQFCLVSVHEKVPTVLIDSFCHWKRSETFSLLPLGILQCISVLAMSGSTGFARYL